MPLRGTTEGKRNPLTGAQEQVIERFRRLHEVIESHPYLSGLMTDDYHAYLRDILSTPESERVEVTPELLAEIEDRARRYELAAEPNAKVNAFVAFNACRTAAVVLALVGRIRELESALDMATGANLLD